MIFGGKWLGPVDKKKPYVYVMEGVSDNAPSWENQLGEVTSVTFVQPGVQYPVEPGVGMTYQLAPPPITGVVPAQGVSRNKKKKTVQAVNDGLKVALLRQRAGVDRAFNLRYAKPQNPLDSAEMNRPFTRLQVGPLEVRKTRKYGREDADSE